MGESSRNNTLLVYFPRSLFGSSYNEKSQFLNSRLRTGILLLVLSAHVTQLLTQSR